MQMLAGQVEQKRGLLEELHSALPRLHDQARGQLACSVMLSWFVRESFCREQRSRTREGRKPEASKMLLLLLFLLLILASIRAAFVWTSGTTNGETLSARHVHVDFEETWRREKSQTRLSSSWSWSDWKSNFASRISAVAEVWRIRPAQTSNSVTSSVSSACAPAWTCSWILAALAVNAGKQNFWPCPKNRAKEHTDVSDWTEVAKAQTGEALYLQFKLCLLTVELFCLESFQVLSFTHTHIPTVSTKAHV